MRSPRISTFRFIQIFWRSIILFLTPLVLLPILLVSSTQAAKCGYVMLIVAVYWVTEAVPLAVSGSIPIFALPLLGILDSKTVALSYMTNAALFIAGGMIIAIAIEHSNLHKRIALLVIMKIGHSTGRLLAGFMLASMFLSMWIPNAAATAMMLPILDAILQELDKTSSTLPVYGQSMAKSTNGTKEIHSIEEREKISSPENNGSSSTILSNSHHAVRPTTRKASKDYADTHSSSSIKDLRNMFFLATAYTSNIGGTGSPTGSGANVVAKNYIDNTFTDPTPLNYSSWVIYNTPGMVICAIMAWIWLQVYFIGCKFWKTRSNKEQEKRTENIIVGEYAKLGSMTFHEGAVLMGFLLCVGLWMFRDPGYMAGWSSIFENAYGNDFAVSNAAAVWLVCFLLFVTPAEPHFWPSSKMQKPHMIKSSAGCLTWDLVQQKLSWGILMLVGGGFALAEASKVSKLSFIVGEQLRAIKVLGPQLSVLFVSTLTSMATEISSNTATSTILIPVLTDMSLISCFNPLFIIVPAVNSCCYAFMLPAATPPNALVHEMTNIKTTTMIKVGFVMNLLCVGVSNLMINTFGIVMFDVHNMPDWTNSTTGNVRCLNSSSVM